MPTGEIGDMAMAVMGGVERATEQPDAHGAPVAEPGGGAQGRTWPWPVTR